MEVHIQQESVREKEKEYKDRMEEYKDRMDSLVAKHEKEASDYKEKISKLTTQLQLAKTNNNSLTTQLSNARQKVENYVAMYNRSDPKVAADILIKELLAKKVSHATIVTGFMRSLVVSRKTSARVIGS